ncbi:MAG: DsbC family protein [Gammaproteobacteria bacterium]|nr:DsbC family protein [Gammaproteobacteria bacterium]
MTSHTMTGRAIQLIAAVGALLIGTSTFGNEHEDALLAAQEKMRATFSNAIVTDFRESPIPGIYEAHTVDKLIYYHPEKELLILGEIWTKDGRSLTAARRAELAAGLFDEIPTAHALVIGPENGKEIVEFTDPDCLYCRRYNAFAQEPGQIPIRRVVFFDTRAHPMAKPKAVHILCSRDQQQAFLDVYAGKEPARWNDCDQGRKQVAVHGVISQNAGVSVTPTLYVDRSPVLGFRRAVIEEALSSHGTSIAKKGD